MVQDPTDGAASNSCSKRDIWLNYLIYNAFIDSPFLEHTQHNRDSDGLQPKLHKAKYIPAPPHVFQSLYQGHILAILHPYSPTGLSLLLTPLVLAVPGNAQKHAIKI